MRIKLLLSAFALAGMAGSTQAAFMNIAEGAGPVSTPSVTYGGVSVVNATVSSEFASGILSFAPVAGDGLGSINILYKDAVTGLNSDFLHVEWAVVNNLVRFQYQFQSEPFLLDPQTVITTTRTETPGWMYVTPGTPGDNLPGGLKIGIQSDLAPVPEPSTYMAGIGAAAMMLGTFLRRARRQN